MHTAAPLCTKLAAILAMVYAALLRAYKIKAVKAINHHATPREKFSNACLLAHSKMSLTVWSCMRRTILTDPNGGRRNRLLPLVDIKTLLRFLETFGPTTTGPAQWHRKKRQVIPYSTCAHAN